MRNRRTAGASASSLSRVYAHGLLSRLRTQPASLSLPVQMDTEGSEVHINDLPGPIKAEKGQEFTFTVRDASQCAGDCFSVR